MEWVAWVTFGPASDEPTEHWVNEAIDDAPETNEPKRKPNGRVDQRRKEIRVLLFGIFICKFLQNKVLIF